MATPIVPARRLERVPQRLARAGWTLDRFEYGPYRGELFCRPARPGDQAVYPRELPQEQSDPLDPGVFPPSAERRARDLLESLLDTVQLAEYRRTGTFWVDTPRGRVRLGELDTVHVSSMGVVRSLCAVPQGWDEMPLPDSWATLLLWLRNDPDHFFAVAIQQDLLTAVPRPEGELTAPAAACTDGSTLMVACDAELRRIEARYWGDPGAQPLQTGFADLDEALRGVGPGDIVAIAGPPGCGRSAFALDLVRNCIRGARSSAAASEPGRPWVDLYTPNGTATTVVRELIANHAGITRDHLVGAEAMSDAEWGRILTAIETIDDISLGLSTGTEAANRIRRDAGKPGSAQAAIAIIDDADALPGDLGDNLRTLRAVAQETPSTIVTVLATGGPDEVLAHPTASLVDVVIEVQPLPCAGPGPQRRVLAITRNRRRPLARADDVLVGEWGRMLPVPANAAR